MDFCVGTKEKFSSRVLSTLLTIDRLCLISGLQSSQYTLVLTWTLVALQYLQTRAFKFEDPVWIQDAQGRSCDVGTRPDLQGFFFFKLWRLRPNRPEYPEVQCIYGKSPTCVQGIILKGLRCCNGARKSTHHHLGIKICKTCSSSLLMRQRPPYSHEPP